jgi:hypothetical protein
MTTTFFDLFVRHSSDETIRDDPTWADRQFPELAAASPFRLWSPGDRIAERGLRYLIGVATWCGYDMRLLDVIAEALSRNAAHAQTIEVFNTADCRLAVDFERYIPGVKEILHTPVVGLWCDSQFDSFLQGHAARERIAGEFGSTSGEIVAFVQEWIKERVLAQ